jgi:hypothetical protein
MELNFGEIALFAIDLARSIIAEICVTPSLLVGVGKLNIQQTSTYAIW